MMQISWVILFFCCLLPFFQINFFKKSFQVHYQSAKRFNQDQNQGSVGPGPRGYKTFSMLNSAEHEIYPAHNVKMPTIVGILTFISMINTISERLKARNFFICLYFSFYEQ